MDILIFEDPDEHKGRTVSDEFMSRVKLWNGESEIVSTLMDAYRALRDKGYQGTIIHHHSFEAVDHLRSLFPDKKFFGYSGAAFTGGNPGSIMSGFNDKLIERYDRLIYSTSCIDEIMLAQ